MGHRASREQGHGLLCRLPLAERAPWDGVVRLDGRLMLLAEVPQRPRSTGRQPRRPKNTKSRSE
jgi:hypothetical protein